MRLFIFALTGPCVTGLVHRTEDRTDGGRNKEGSASNSDRDGRSGGIKKFSFDDEDDLLAVQAGDMDAATLSNHGTKNDLSHGQHSDQEQPTVHSLLMETDAPEGKNAIERKYLKEYQEAANRQLAEQQKLDKLQVELDVLPKNKRRTSRARFLRDEIIKTKNRIKICQSIQTRLETNSPLTYLINREIKPRLAETAKKASAEKTKYDIMKAEFESSDLLTRHYEKHRKEFGDITCKCQ